MGRPEEQSSDLYGQRDNADNSSAAEFASYYEIPNNTATPNDQQPPPYGQPPNPPPPALYQQQPPPPRPAQYPPQMNPPPPESYPPQKPPPPSAYPPQRPPPPAAFPPQSPLQQPAAYPPTQPPYTPQAGPQPSYQPTYQQVHQFPPPQPNYGQVPQSPMKPTAQGFPVGGPAVNSEGWKTGLFDCMDDPTNAAITFLFPCLTFGQIAEIIDNGQTSCATGAVLYALIASFIGLPCIYSCTYRTKMRSKFGLVEAPAPDWLVHFVCEPCALCQAYRELNLRGFDPAIGWIGNVARSQQQQQQVMMTPPQNQTMYN